MGCCSPFKLYLKVPHIDNFPQTIKGKPIASSGWDFIFSENHWSTLKTINGLVHKILLPYKHSQIEQLGTTTLENDLVFRLLVCTQEQKFFNWMKKNHPNIFGYLDTRNFHK
jgi:hypothetical protein